jgi:RHS repeat-associated protein
MGSNGTQNELYHYDAYGLPINFDPTTALTSYLKDSEPLDLHTNLIHLRARDYNFGQGAFTTLDGYSGNHLDPLSFNKYQFVHANPITSIDPSGLSEIGVVGSLGAMNIQVTIVNNKSSVDIAASQVAAVEAYKIATTSLLQQIAYTSVAVGIGAGPIFLAHNLGRNTHVNQYYYNANRDWDDSLYRKKLLQDIYDDTAPKELLKDIYDDHELSSKMGVKYGLFEPIDVRGQSSIPIFFEHVSVLQEVALNGLYAQLEGHRMLLEYDPDRNSQRIRRDMATGPYQHLRNGAFNELDEYPFASTYQGGNGARIEAVRDIMNHRQGGLYGVFIRHHSLSDKDPFLTIIIP